MSHHSITQYPITISEDDNGTFLVTFPDFPEAVTFGKGIEDAQARASLSIDEAIHARIAHRKDIPLPSRIRKYAADVDPLTVAKALLYMEMKRQNVKKASLARRLKCNQKQIDRIVDVHHNSTISQLARAYAALGKRLVIGLAD